MIYVLLLIKRVLSETYQKIYEQNNRLGYALVMKTHMDYVIKNIEAFNQDKGSGRSLLKKEKKLLCAVI